ncbi:uncharacterized protein LOC142614931 [Castanea sativa]|uniref:uncharacterized protein LOC142614931 n=1 Tax=Castanea sativa TaxID=21020 RepID=UPI003F64AA20
MSLKEFEHSVVHDLFKAMSKFIVASRHATEIDKERAKLETKLRQVKDECRNWAEVAGKATDEVKELKNLIEELRADIIEKDTCLDHFQKRNDELSTLLKDAKKVAEEEFKASSQFTDLLDGNYAAGFEDFRMEAIEHFPKVDFSLVKIQLGGSASSLLQTSSEDVNIEDDATTKPPQDNPNADAPSI